MSGSKSGSNKPDQGANPDVQGKGMSDVKPSQAPSEPPQFKGASDPALSLFDVLQAAKDRKAAQAESSASQQTELPSPASEETGNDNPRNLKIALGVMLGLLTVVTALLVRTWLNDSKPSVVAAPPAPPAFIPNALASPSSRSPSPAAAVSRPLTPPKPDRPVRTPTSSYDSRDNQPPPVTLSDPQQPDPGTNPNPNDDSNGNQPSAEYQSLPQQNDVSQPQENNSQTSDYSR